jgi:hypothetical protein
MQLLAAPVEKTGGRKEGRVKWRMIMNEFGRLLEEAIMTCFKLLPQFGWQTYRLRTSFRISRIKSRNTNQPLYIYSIVI